MTSCLSDADITEQHPVFNPLKLVLETAPMRVLQEDLRRWVWTGCTGAVILGASRCGKTTAMHHLCARLESRSGKPIPVLFFTVPRRDRRTIASLYRNLCISAQLRTRSRDTPEEMLAPFIDYILDLVTEFSSNRLVLVVDEMQRLALNQLDVFAELYDVLRKPHNVSLTVLFVGNERGARKLLRQIADEHDGEDEDREYLRGRFFMHATKFYGLDTVDALSEVLRQYDVLRFPVDTGPTYTEFFLPEAVADGWTLRSLSRPLWRVYREYEEDYNLSGWGMQYVTGAVNTLLTDLLPRCGVDHIEDDLFHKCIAVSGLVPSLVEAGS